MLPSLTNRLAVHIKKVRVYRVFDTKYFALCKSAVLNLLIKLTSDK